MANKYIYLHVIQGHYPGGNGWEDEAASESIREARADLRAYRENSPYPSRMISRREPNPAYST